MNFTFGADELILNFRKKLEKKNRIVRKKQKLYQFNHESLNFINPKPSQILSIGTGLVPFIEHNDANRGLMGSNMQRQALPLLYKETPIVGTEIGKLVGKNSSFTMSAKKSGLVKYVSSRKIIIKESKEKKLNFLVSKYKSLEEKTERRMASNQTDFILTNYKKRSYYLKEEKKSNQNTSIKQNPIVKKNEWVIKGQTIVDNNSTKNSEIAIGKNILIGYLCWEGYNFEDAIVISEKIVENDIFTSTHIKRYKTFIIKDETREVRTKINIENLNYVYYKYLYGY